MRKKINWSLSDGAVTRTQRKAGFDWDTFVDLVKHPEVQQDKKDCTAIIPAVLYQGQTNRRIENVEYYDILGLDIDNSVKVKIGVGEDGGWIVRESLCDRPVTPEILQEAAWKAGIASVGYETWSNKAEWPKCRLFVPLSRRILPSELGAVVDMVVEQLGLREYPHACDIKTMKTNGKLFFCPGTKDANKMPLVWDTEGVEFVVPASFEGYEEFEYAPMPIAEEAQAAMEAWKEANPAGLGDGDKYWLDYPIHFTTLDVYGLVKELGLNPGKQEAYASGYKARCHCPWEAEHSGGVGKDDAVIFWGECEWPRFSCSHTGHSPAKSLKDLAKFAGTEMLLSYAEEKVETEESDEMRAVLKGEGAFDSPLTEDEEVEAMMPKPKKAKSKKQEGPHNNPDIGVHEQEASAIESFRKAVKAKLSFDVIMKKKVPRRNLANLIYIFKHDPSKANKFALNTMTQDIYFDGQLIESPGDFATDVHCWLDKKYNLNFSQMNVIREAMRACAVENPFNPLQNYLNGLKWDGKDRVMFVLEAFKMEQTELHLEYIRRWMIGAVKRAFEPGCKMDYMLVLSGTEGDKKSSFFSALGGEWFGDSPLDWRSKEGAQVIHQSWIHEISEADDILRHSGDSAVKAFITRQEDMFRPSYGIAVLKFKRTVVMGATMNPGKEEALTTVSGDRRLWIIATGETGKVDSETIDEFMRAIRDQLWAQAVVAYKKGEKNWLPGELEEDRKKANDEFRQKSQVHLELLSKMEVLKEMVLESSDTTSPILNNYSGITMKEVVVVIGEDSKVINWSHRGILLELGQLLRKYGWEKRRVEVNGTKQTYWFIKEEALLNSTISNVELPKKKDRWDEF